MLGCSFLRGTSMLNSAALRLFAGILVIITALFFFDSKATASVTLGRACAITSARVETEGVEMPKAESKRKRPHGAATLEVSGYTSSRGQTDATPCIAADQSDICARKRQGELICATNVYPLGSRIHVEGLGTCVVADRMNSRYQAHVDWYFGQDGPREHVRYDRARKIGRATRTVTLVSSP